MLNENSREIRDLVRDAPEDGVLKSADPEAVLVEQLAVAPGNVHDGDHGGTAT